MTDGNAPVARGYPDIVERLRLRAEIEHLAADIAVKARLLTAQTKEIERLRTDVQRQPDPIRESLQEWVDQGYIDAEGDHCGAAAYCPALYVKSLAALGSSSQDSPVHIEIKRLSGQLADAQKIIAEYKAGTIARAKADVAAHGLPGARGQRQPDLAAENKKLIDALRTIVSEYGPDHGSRYCFRIVVDVLKDVAAARTSQVTSTGSGGAA